MKWLLDLLFSRGSAFRRVNRRQELSITPEMREAEEAQDAVTLQSQTEKVVAKRDEKEICRKLAE